MDCSVCNKDRTFFLEHCTYIWVALYGIKIYFFLQIEMLQAVVEFIENIEWA